MVNYAFYRMKTREKIEGLIRLAIEFDEGGEFTSDDIKRVTGLSIDVAQKFSKVLENDGVIEKTRRRGCSPGFFYRFSMDDDELDGYINAIREHKKNSTFLTDTIQTIYRDVDYFTSYDVSDRFGVCLDSVQKALNKLITHRVLNSWRHFVGGGIKGGGSSNSFYSFKLSKDDIAEAYLSTTDVTEFDPVPPSEITVRPQLQGDEFRTYLKFYRQRQRERPGRTDGYVPQEYKSKN